MILINILYVICSIFWSIYVMKSIYHRDGRLTFVMFLRSLFSGIICPFSIISHVMQIKHTHKKRYSVFIKKEWLKKVDPRYHDKFNNFILRGDIDSEFFSYLRGSHHCREAVRMAFDEIFYDQKEILVILPKR